MDQANPQNPVVTQQVGKYQVRVLNDKCIGAASCVAISAAVFRLNEQNIAEVISQNDTDEAKLLAAQSCPTTAIEVTDTTTGEIVWPK
jgi:ferredoxin